MVKEAKGSLGAHPERLWGREVGMWGLQSSGRKLDDLDRDKVTKDSKLNLRYGLDKIEVRQDESKPSSVMG